MNHESHDPTDRAALWAKLREPFPPEVVLKKPQLNRADPNARKVYCAECGSYHPANAVHLDYLGHAVITDRLNTVLGVDNWNIEPAVRDEFGAPVYDRSGGMWFKITILGKTMWCYGDAQGKEGPNAVKEIIGDAIRNGAMRFGVGLYLWTKNKVLESDLESPQLAEVAPPQQLAAPEPEPAAAPALLTEFDIDDLLLSMRSASTVEQLREDLRAVWPRATPDQREVLHAAFDRCKAELPSEPAHSGIGPRVTTPPVPQPRASRRKH